MSENQNRRLQELSKFDAMTTEELEEILRLDAETPEEQESDTEMLLYIMGILADRRKETGHAGKTALEAYESFKKNYMPKVEEDVIMPDHEVKPKVRSRRWLRTLCATAAVVVIVLLGSVTAKAFGVDVWQSVVKWTQETFHFGDGLSTDDAPNVNDGGDYTSLQDALDKAEIETRLVPTWIPEGYQLTDVRVEETPTQNTYYAIYKNNAKTLKITVRDYLSSNPQYVEQSDNLTETYEVSGNTYYIFSNNERNQAAWITGSFECYIFGDATIEEMKLMIDSIEKG